MASLSLSKEHLSKIKIEAARGKPYADRISIALAFRLLPIEQSRLDIFSVLDEIDYLEGITSFSRTKKESQFKNPPLFPFWHKHFFSAQHILKNIGVRWDMSHGGNKDLEVMISDVAKNYGDQPDVWINHLAHTLVIEGYEERAERGLTGDWLIFAKCDGLNYYLDLATHEEGKADVSHKLYEKLKNGCNAEFPFLFS